MKKLKNKLFLLVTLSVVFTPIFSVYAEEPTSSPTPTPGVSASPTPTPSSTPEPSPSATPEPTSSPTPTPEEVKPKLSSLKITGATLNRNFAPDENNYTAVVSSKVESVTIDAVGVDGTTVNGNGSYNLKEGENKINITVVAGTTGGSREYTIKITKATSNLDLKSLRITGQTLNETFDPTILDYTADISYDIESVIVNASASNSDGKISILGNTNLKVGKNTIKVIVKNSAGETQEYRIVVNRAMEDEEEESDDETNSVVSSEEATNTLVATPAINNDDSDNDKEDNTFKYILIVIFCILLLTIAGLGIFFYVKSENQEKRRQKRIEKLKKKQEKINQELTGLLPVIDEELINSLESKEDDISDEIDSLEDTIELEMDEIKEKADTKKTRKRVDRDVLEDFDDLFLDE